MYIWQTNCLLGLVRTELQVVFLCFPRAMQHLLFASPGSCGLKIDSSGSPLIYYVFLRSAGKQCAWNLKLWIYYAALPLAGCIRLAWNWNIWTITELTFKKEKGEEKNQFELILSILRMIFTSWMGFSLIRGTWQMQDRISQWWCHPYMR